MSNNKCLFFSVCICLLSQTQFALCALCLCETVVKNPPPIEPLCPWHSTHHVCYCIVFSHHQHAVHTGQSASTTSDAHPHCNLFSQSPHFNVLTDCEKQVNQSADFMTWRCFTEFNLKPWRVHAFLKPWLLPEGKLLFVCTLVFPPWKRRCLWLIKSLDEMQTLCVNQIPRNVHWKFHQSYKSHFLLH